jgi:Spy/CpxP family protein refolding chaperone
MKRTHAVAAALAVLLLVPALASAARNPRPSPADILHSPKLLARYLNLSAAHVTQEEALFKTLGDALKAIREQEKAVRDQLAAELAKPTPDACTAGGYVVRIDALYEQTAAALRTFDTAFSAILTPEQLAKYNALKELAHIGNGPR